MNTTNLMYLTVSVMPPNSLLLEVEDCTTSILIEYEAGANLDKVHVEAAQVFALFCRGVLESEIPEPRLDGQPGFRFKIVLQTLH